MCFLLGASLAFGDGRLGGIRSEKVSELMYDRFLLQ